jgi:hypothetical protein
MNKKRISLPCLRFSLSYKTLYVTIIESNKTDAIAIATRCGALSGSAKKAR